MSGRERTRLGPPHAGFFAEILQLVYFLYSGLRSDHERREYGFTLGVAVVALSHGLRARRRRRGLYLVVERDYPACRSYMGSQEQAKAAVNPRSAEAVLE